MDVQGGDGIRQPTSNIVTDYWPTWSPDSPTLVFLRDRDGRQDIYVAELSEDYSIVSLRQLTTHGASDRHAVWRQASE